MKKCFLASFVIVAMMGFAVGAANAAVITATSCNAAAVTQAVSSAANGDTVVIPSGTCTWTGTVNISKAITLQGQGVGSTIIMDAASTPLLWWTLVPNQTSRMTGIEFRNAGGSHPGNAGVVVLNGSNADGRRMRVDHCDFEDLSGVALVSNEAIGVIDHNTYTGTPTNRFVNVWHNNWDGAPWGDKSWSTPTNFGSENFLFVEDNDITFLGGTHYAVIDAFGGARYVFRYNTVTRGWVEAHGTESGGRYRGTRAIEVYNNRFIGNDAGAYLVNVRSGVVVIHDNIATGYMSNPRFELTNYRVDQSFQPFGQANGSNPWDKNVNGSVVTVLDQPCVSGGSLISGDTPVLPWAAGQNNQAVDACYQWNNTEDGTPVGFMAGHGNIREGVHFFQNMAKPGYTPYTYPHPLISGGGGGGGGGSSAPQAPSNLRISSQ